MELFNGIRAVHRHWTIFIYPILFDLIGLALGLYFIGFYGKAITSVKLVLEMGLPSISHISNIPLFVNNFFFLTNPAEKTAFLAITLVIMLLVGAFLQGGYIRFLYMIVKKEEYSFFQFIKDGKKYWLQFILLEVIVQLLRIGLTAFLIIFFPYIGSFISLMTFIILRILFIYLEFTIVIDHVSIPDALKLSRRYLRKSFLPSLTVVMIMYLVTSSLSLVLHVRWTFSMVICVLLLYAYLMTLIQSVLMSIFCQVRAKNSR
ncbi:hypothetical protein MUB24_07730 [Lederbergia sp. NSJ-179]|uniref:hypothetical protein n=1 Tax=Lederbergia sp. NSJ-179 TaxID=2931402 RepID=UPI001FD30D19|nr:hypothetical protein [Lederbergia sp. NSJ-179]MCJ7840797.1 hypothetical protein [Lederbergia sp. NSJ-179]